MNICGKHAMTPANNMPWKEKLQFMLVVTKAMVNKCLTHKEYVHPNVHSTLFSTSNPNPSTNLIFCFHV